MLFVHSILLQDIMKNNNIVRAYQLFPDSPFLNCEFFVKLIKKSLTICLWQDRKIHPDFLWRKAGAF